MLKVLAVGAVLGLAAVLLVLDWLRVFRNLDYPDESITFDCWHG